MSEVGETLKLVGSKVKIRSKNRVIRNFTYKLHDVENVFTSKISFFLKELNKQLNALVNSDIYTKNKRKLDKVLNSKGNFRTELLRLLKQKEYKDFYQKHYFDAEIFGNKAKYFRTVIEEYRRILLSRLQQQTVIDMIVKNPTITYQEVFNKLCELNERSASSDYQFNWISKADFNNIIKQLDNLSNLDKLSSLFNLKSKTENVSESTSIDIYAIDYSSEDDRISEFNLTESEDKKYYFIEFKLKYSDCTTKSDSLLTYQCKVPKKQIKGIEAGRTKLKKITRPRVYLGTDNNQLYISFNYELLPLEFSNKINSENEHKNVNSELNSGATARTRTMGIDIGVIKSATAAIIDCSFVETQLEINNFDNSSNLDKLLDSNESENKMDKELCITKLLISDELTISEPTQLISKHINVLKTEQRYIFKKEKHIARLLKLDHNYFELNKNGMENSLLFKTYKRLREHRLHLRSKVSNLKKELSCLTARDMISHAIDNNVDLITLEQLSWIRNQQHTTWDYNQIQQKIIHEANIYGIKVKKVSCAYSSKHNPLTLEKDEVDKNRKLVKCLFDRDYAAAIILARRGIKLGKRKLKLNPSCEAASHINDSFQAVSCSIKPSLQYRQLKLCEPNSVIYNSNFMYYSIL